MRFAIGLALMLLAGCSTTSRTDMVFDPPDEEPADSSEVVATFTLVQDEILVPSCALSGCHADFQFPILTRSRAYSSIVGIASSAGMPLIDPGAPATSYLYLKVTGQGAGGRMPAGAPALTQARIDLLRAWIEGGALDD